ncbi:MAG: hypothetical protein R3Y56_03225 [Akkermansia sp.]
MKIRSTILTTPLAISLIAAGFAHANEQGMKSALAQWDQEISEYQAALANTTEEGQRNILLANPPTGDSIAQQLWKETYYRIGTREITEKKTHAPKNRFDIPKVKKIPVYAYEEPWAAPAVAWWLTHPHALTGILTQQQCSRVIAAMIDSVERTHFDKACMADVCVALSSLSSMQAYECLKKIQIHNPDAAAKANAAMGLSLMLNKAPIRSAEGSEEMADAKRIYYIKEALSIAPKDCMFGHARIEVTANEQIHLVTKLAPGRVPPQVDVLDAEKRQLMFPIPNQAQILLFWSPEHAESIALLRRSGDLAAKYPQIKIIPIAVGADRDAVKQCYEAEEITIPSYSDQDSAAAKEYRVGVLPYVAFIGDENTLVYLGYPDLNFQSKITSYLKDNSDKPALPVHPIPAAEEPRNSDVPQIRDMPEL